MHLFNLCQIGIVFAAAAMIGCGPPITAGKKTIASGSSKGETEKPELISFQLRITEPLVGRVIATRTLERRNLETLSSKIEWDIRLEPSDEGLQISSRDPHISPLHSRLPEDALNQLLIGRMFLPSGFLANDGTFLAAAGTAESVQSLHAALSAANNSQLSSTEIQQFLSNALSVNVMETTCRAHWKSMVQSFIGENLQLGKTYERESPSEMPLGGEIVFASKYKVVAHEPCESGPRGCKCVRIESLSRPKRSIVDFMLKSGLMNLPPGASFEFYDVICQTVQVLDPSTLVPHSMKMEKTTIAEVRLANGLKIPFRELSTETWQYVW